MSKNVPDRLHIATEFGEDIVVDLRRNNGRKPKSEEFWQVRRNKALGKKVAYISEFVKLISFFIQSELYFTLKMGKLISGMKPYSLPSYSGLSLVYVLLMPCSRKID